MNTLLNLLFFNAYANSVAQLRQVAKRHDVADGEPGNDNLAGGGLGAETHGATLNGGIVNNIHDAGVAGRGDGLGGYGYSGCRRSFFGSRGLRLFFAEKRYARAHLGND